MSELDSLTKRLADLEKQLRASDTEQASKKLAINGSFGKLGSKWSVLYSPNLLIQVTVTGQLALLMLIERMEAAGIEVISANTDGIVTKRRPEQNEIVRMVIEQWERDTGFETENAGYKALYSRDVNGYVGIKTDNTVKLKGPYASTGLQKNPSSQVCIDAVIEYLTNGTDIRDTIEMCFDIRRFVTIRQVKGGAVKDDRYLGKAVRWYYAKGVSGAIHYKINGNKVPKSDGAKPLMDLPEHFPDDIDYDWYVREANEMLIDIGAF